MRPLENNPVDSPIVQGPPVAGGGAGPGVPQVRKDAGDVLDPEQLKGIEAAASSGGFGSHGKAYPTLVMSNPPVLLAWVFPSWCREPTREETQAACKHNHSDPANPPYRQYGRWWSECELCGHRVDVTGLMKRDLSRPQHKQFQQP